MHATHPWEEHWKPIPVKKNKLDVTWVKNKVSVCFINELMSEGIQFLVRREVGGSVDERM